MIMGWRSGFAMVIAVTLSVAACGGATPYVRGLSPQEKAQAGGIPVHAETLPDGSYKLVQRVEGVSCRVNAIDNYQVTKEEAMEELRYAALKAGGTEVMEVSCERPRFSQSEYLCAESIVCRGVAVNRRR